MFPISGNDNCNANWTSRYSRQIVLDEIGEEGQNKLKNSAVLVIGAGGLGSPALLYLAASGVGRIGIADFDTADLSNLNRQILYSEEDLGLEKAGLAAKKLKRLNSQVQIDTYPYRIGDNNIEDIVKGYDAVIDAVDNFATRFLINDCCYFLKKPVIDGAVIGFEGILLTVIPDKSPCYRCMYPEPPPQADKNASVSNSGIIGATAGIMGSFQALECIKVLLGIGETLSGRILTFNGLTMEIRTVNWKRRGSCPLCGTKPTIRISHPYQSR